MFNLKSIFLIFLVCSTVKSKKMNGQKRFLEYVPPPTISYRHSLIQEATHCISVCEECFNETNKNQAFLVILIFYKYIILYLF